MDIDNVTIDEGLIVRRIRDVEREAGRRTRDLSSFGSSILEFLMEIEFRTALGVLAPSSGFDEDDVHGDHVRYYVTLIAKLAGILLERFRTPPAMAGA
jgi:hypothetical protein